MVNDNRNIYYVGLHVGKKLKQQKSKKAISQDDLTGSLNLTFKQWQKYKKVLIE